MPVSKHTRKGKVRKHSKRTGKYILKHTVVTVSKGVKK